MQSKDFAGSLPGLTLYFKCSDSKHGKVVLPESMVIRESVHAAQQRQHKDNVPSQGSNVDARELMHAQFRGSKKMVQQVTEQSEDEYLKDVLNTVRIDREQQALMLREIEKAHKEKTQSGSGSQRYVHPNDPQSRYEVIPGPADSSNPPPYQHHPSFRPSGPNEQRIRGGIDEHQDLKQFPNSAHRPQVSHGDPGNQLLYDNLPGVPQRFEPLEEWRPDNRPTVEQLGERHHSDNQAFSQHKRQEGARDFQAHHQQQQDMKRQEMEGAERLQEQLLQQHGATQAQPPHNGTHPNNALLSHGAGTLVLQETILHSFSVGSTFQLLSNPPRYGVIQWIGTLPGILEGHIAGVELVRPVVQKMCFRTSLFG